MNITNVFSICVGVDWAELLESTVKEVCQDVRESVGESL